MKYIHIKKTFNVNTLYKTTFNEIHSISVQKCTNITKHAIKCTQIKKKSHENTFK